MAEVGSFSESDYDKNNPKITNVRVWGLSPDGVLTLTEISENNIRGKPVALLYAKIPMISNFAFEILKRKFPPHATFTWLSLPGPSCYYNSFVDNDGINATLDALHEIINSDLPSTLMLPEMNLRGHCRISPLCDENKIYVQMQPEYVDTLTCYIFFRVATLQKYGLIRPAETIELLKLYIMSRGYENYRVIVDEEVVSQEPHLFHKQSLTKEIFVGGIDSNDVVQLDDNYSRICGEPFPSSDCELMIDQNNDGKRDESEKTFGSEDDKNIHYPLNIVTGDEVYVFPIDFGGPKIRVHRNHLYDVEEVNQKLRGISQLAFPVIFRSVDKYYHDIEARFEHLKIRQKLIDIRTVTMYYPCRPQVVDVFTNVFHQE